MKIGQKSKERGFTLIELLVAIGITSIVMAIVYSAYVTFIKSSAIQGQSARQEMITQTSLPVMIKEIESAGFGLDMNIQENAATPVVDDRDPANGLVASTNTITIRSDYAGDQMWSGAWATTDANGNVVNWTMGNIPADGTVKIVVLDSNKNLQKGPVAYDATPMPINDIVYKVKSGNSSNPPYYYITRYYLGGTAPQDCATGTQNLERAVYDTEAGFQANNGGPQPIMSCVLAFEVRYGIWDGTKNTILWDTAPPSDFSLLRMVRIGMVVQKGTRDNTYTAPAALTLFPDLGANAVAVSLNTAQRSYRWTIVDEKIALKSLGY